MPGLFKRALQKARSNLSEVKFDGVVLSIVLGFLVLVIAGNIIRIFTNGQSNYATYLEEGADLEKLLEKNQVLSEEYKYVTSDEYKALLLRDAQNLAKPEENLFSTKDKASFFFEELEYLDIQDKTEFSDWWAKLIAW